MKKTLLILVLFMLSAGLFSQSSLIPMTEFGPTSYSDNLITSHGSPTSTLSSKITVMNGGSETVTLRVIRQNLMVLDNTTNEFCWGPLCYPADTDTSGNQQSLLVVIAPGESDVSFEGKYHPEGQIGISMVKYTFWDINNSANNVSVTVVYNTIFELTCAGDDTIAPNTRKLNGDVDTPIHDVIKVHNYSPVPLNLIAFKTYVPVPVVGAADWMFFDGNEYAYGTDTTGMVSIPASTTDETFEMFYAADGNEGITQVVYTFLDPTNPSNFAPFWIIFDAKITGISDEVLANTTFSNAYPNPAESFVSFNYDIPNEVHAADIMITNLLGAVVYEGSLSGNVGTTRIDVSNFTEGIYFATLRLDGQIASTQKVLVQ